MGKLRTVLVSSLGVALGSAGCLPAHAQAQADATGEIEGMVTASAGVATGMALAREQGAAGDLIGAAATLERVLLLHPDADEVRLAHAGLLCRLDDPDGARAEIGELDGHDLSDAAWTEATAACGPLARPAGAGQ